ncbi:MAG TPA: hypothetical protein VMS88_07230, partial [Terriglobales bacterium]|nr:hypothetical protein [Terriglobales bacterium]
TAMAAESSSGPGGSAGARGGAAWGGARGAGGRAGRGPGGAGARGDSLAGDGEAPRAKPGVVYVMRDGKPVPVDVMTGLTDGTSVELVAGDLRAGDQVVTGMEVSARSGANLTPPPGMGGPMFGPPRGGGGGGRR